MPLHQQLPPLEDVNHTINHGINHFDTHPFSLQFQDPQNHDHTPQFDHSIKSTSACFDPTSPASLELLSMYRSKFKHSRQGFTDEIVTDCAGTLSTLLTAAERAGRKQFEIAGKFLIRCGLVASDGGTPVERLVYYLCDALQNRIGKETGIPVPMKPKKIGLKNKNPMAMGTNPTFLACHQTLPFNQVLQFCGIQAIIDQVGASSKVHLIDIHIRSGVQWTAMMQALIDRKSEITLLKLTAFATSSDVQKVEETGKRLESFAKTLSLPFLFKILVLSDITEVKEDQFEVQDDEAVAVYCQLILRTMISRPQSLENLMRAIRTINPLVIVVAEVEASHNSTSFVKRFTEALFFYGAFFDCLEACMSRDDVHRGIVEGVHLADGMKDIVAYEGDERVSRSVNINTWRLFFTRFEMVEIELSESCMYQANLVLQQFSCASSCMLESNGKCLLVGWKGTPLHSLSTWKFDQE
ncbi:hypothetical protein L1987_31823 [Smallanthus sonchifolius]|uniref:Uncharacterized protein n=1 Tax=Smallanthus sonchifolius TaxID=185202 RepID=A0ACB9I611_9ASTR|nr:hypothetical protein L1987_31823 [Smallanthus sonchifolius]